MSETSKIEWRTRALSYVVEIYKVAALRWSFWQKALATVEEDARCPKRAQAAWLIGAFTDASGQKVVTTIEEDGLNHFERWRLWLRSGN